MEHEDGRVLDACLNGCSDVERPFIRGEQIVVEKMGPLDGGTGVEARLEVRESAQESKTGHHTMRAHQQGAPQLRSDR